MAESLDVWPPDWPRYHNANNEPCDVAVGPCACGAWHLAGEFEMRGGTLYRYGRPVAGRRPSEGSTHADAD
jgi:hypothetical protein